ncbi:MAG: sulfotransferase family 2 domain-containing protein [Halioglobus sp.]
MPDARPISRPLVLSRKIVFLHIAKTAGTSIVHFFRKHMPPESICSHGDFLHLGSDRIERQESLGAFQFVSGHFGYDEVAALLPDAYSFTFLRDPIDRVLSFYQFCMHEEMQRQFPVARAAKDLGLDGFVHSTAPEVSEAMDNLQCWQLARSYWHEDRQMLARLNDSELLQLAETHLEELSHIGLTETFDLDVKKMLKDLGIQRKLPKGKQFVTTNPIVRDSLKPSTLATLEQRVALDTALHDRIRSRRTSLDLDWP